MNIVTFATPVSVAPPKLWVVSLYTNTLTHRSFLDSKIGVLQLLTPSQKGLVSMLGKRSGYESGFSKRTECRIAKFGWIAGGDGSGASDLADENKQNSSDSFFSNDEESAFGSLDLLPACASYIKLKVRGITEAGDHDVALCEVVGTGVWDEATRRIRIVKEGAMQAPHDPCTALYTAQLRDEGII